jgi:hypothetical protein
MTTYVAGSEVEILSSFNGTVSTDARIAVSGVNRAGFSCNGTSESGVLDFAGLTEGWFHVRMASLTVNVFVSNFINNTAFLRNSTNQNLVTFARGSQDLNSWRVQILSEPTVTISGNEADWYIHFKIDPTVGFVRVYRNQALVTNLEGAVQFASGTQEVSRFTMSGITATTPGSQATGYSQLLCSSDPTLGARVHTLPLSAGSVNTWATGTVTDINDTANTPGTFIATDTNGDEILFEMGDISAITPGNGIRALVMSTSSQTLSGSPVTNQRGRVKLGATTYDMGAAVAPGTGFKRVQHILDLDPATTLPWVSTDINAAEIGLKAET